MDGFGGDYKKKKRRVEGATLIRRVISRKMVGHHRWVKRMRITIDCCNSPALERSRQGSVGGLNLPLCVRMCVRVSRLMKRFVTSLMTKGTRLHRHGITDVKTNLAP